MKRLFVAIAALALSAVVSAQSFTVEWDDPPLTDPATKHFKATFPPQVLTTLAGAIAQVQAAPVTAPTAAPPVTLAPGDGRYAKVADGSVISLGADGSIYRDGSQLTGTVSGAVVKAVGAAVVVIGKSVYSKGKTDGQWRLWIGGTGSGWSTPLTTLDATVFQ